MKSSTLHAHLIALAMACLTTAVMLGAIDGLALSPEPGSVLAQITAPAAA